MSSRLRAVLDTNVFVAAALSKNANSPTRELLARWQRGEFTLIVCDQLTKEVIEKLMARKIAPALIEAQLTALVQAAEWVEIPVEKIAALLADPDDNVIVACAVEGQAHYLVTYDPHFDILGGEYQGITIVKAIPFLEVLRQAQQ